MKGRDLSAALRRGLWVALALLVLAAGEYLLLLVMGKGNLPYMIFVNVVDAALIAYFFMHIAQLRHPGEE